MINKRVVPAIIIVAVTVACILACAESRILFLSACAAASIWEMYSILKKNGKKSAPAVGYVYIAAHCALCLIGVNDAYLVALFLLAEFALLFFGVLSSGFSGEGAFSALAVFAYPTAFYAFVIRLGAADGWLPVFAIAILSSWICDSAALFCGKRFGKHKVAPLVSPNKTVEGCIGGALSSLLVGVIMYFVFKASAGIPFFVCVLTSFVCSSFGQVGDLAASLIKRMCGVKDYSSLIPEHGGIMDKFDSMLFSIPACWFCLFVFGAI